jgi:hypothetical protein
MSDEDDDIAGRYSSGSLDDVDDLNRLIERAWQEVIRDPSDLAEIARDLNVPASELASAKPPVVAKTGKSGFTGAEFIIIFATAFATAILKEAGTAVGKKVWRILYRRMNRIDPEALGREVDSTDD